jgi:hypothetical protein
VFLSAAVRLIAHVHPPTDSGNRLHGTSAARDTASSPTGLSASSFRGGRRSRAVPAEAPEPTLYFPGLGRLDRHAVPTSSASEASSSTA